MLANVTIKTQNTKVDPKRILWSLATVQIYYMKVVWYATIIRLNLNITLYASKIPGTKPGFYVLQRFCFDLSSHESFPRRLVQW
ncbi:hypothetical protein CCAX7_39940 [Capsulimonas corticalis]|uniref:Uncharacterized protein n=1 Tax=Capsulimonas corticalis TaxID=2219043 RepID=A0A9N7L6X0_9BACT|nr:hypothetical protein CCAX7_39940 [Capsulimonas corticalis]